MPLSHFAINTTPAKFDETVEFYKKALTPLGYTAILDYKFLFGFGTAPGQHDFWIYKKETLVLGEDCDIHFAFQADDKKVVAAWHAAALEAGGKCNGPPGPRPQYGPKYYGAFVIDPMGNNAEAVSMDADQE